MSDVRCHFGRRVIYPLIDLVSKLPCIFCDFQLSYVIRQIAGLTVGHPHILESGVVIGCDRYRCFFNTNTIYI